MGAEASQKLLKWFGHKPEKIAPVQAAAAMHACVRDIEAEDWGEHDYMRASALKHLQAIKFALFTAENYRKIGQPYTPRMHKMITRTFDAMSPIEQTKLISGGRLKPLGIDEDTDAALRHFIHTSGILEDREFRSFGKRAERVAQSQGYGLDDYYDVMNKILDSGFQPDVRASILDSNRMFIGAMNNFNHSVVVNRHRNLFSPSDGPVSTYELALCWTLYARVKGSPHRPFKSLDQSLHLLHSQKIAGSVLTYLDDLFSDQLVERVKADIADFFAQVRAEGMLMVPHDMAMVGLTRYYLQNGADRLSAKDAAFLERALDSFYKHAIEEQVKEIGLTPDVERYGEAHEYAKNFWMTYDRQTPDEVAQEVKDLIAQRYNPGKARRLTAQFEKVRDARPEGMEEQVILYYREDEGFRKLRKSIFKNGQVRGEDGPRVAFIKSLANDNVEGLRGWGFSDRDIEEMRERGVIPKKNCAAEPMTVEHIFDREYGGTNHAHNFMLMPARLNAQKDELKRTQLSAFDDAASGAWMITWVPRKNSDGSYPKIWDHNL